MKYFQCFQLHIAGFCHITSPSINFSIYVLLPAIRYFLCEQLRDYMVRWCALDYRTNLDSSLRFTDCSFLPTIVLLVLLVRKMIFLFCSFIMHHFLSLSQNWTATKDLVAISTGHGRRRCRSPSCASSTALGHWVLSCPPPLHWDNKRYWCIFPSLS